MKFSLLLLPCLMLAADPPLVVQNANILTVTKGTIKGSILVENGKIKEVGEKVMLPPTWTRRGCGWVRMTGATSVSPYS